MLYDSTYRKSLEQSNSWTESTMMVARGWSKGSREFLFSGYGVGKMKRVLETDDGDDCTTT